MERRNILESIMNVLFDYQIFARQKFGGISRYFYEIKKRMAQTDNVNIKGIFLQNYYIRDGKKIVNYRNNFIAYIIRVINFIYMRIYIVINHRKIDIIHPTYAICYGKWIKKLGIKQIITVHDLIPEKYWNSSPTLGQKFTLINKRKSIMLADAIITVSKQTKKDLLSFYPNINPRKIKVIYHGSYTYDDIPYIDMRACYGEYIIYVGNRNAYKNFDMFCKAFSIIKKEFPLINCVCAGGGLFNSEEKHLLSKLNLNSCFFQKNVSDNELINLYRNARCFVFPSKYEGFGIPILEAFSAGCPVILSDSSCFPEIAGDAAIYFDCNDYKDIAAKIRKLLLSTDLATHLTNFGKIRAKEYSWNCATKKTIEIYMRAIENDL